MSPYHNKVSSKNIVELVANGHNDAALKLMQGKCDVNRRGTYHETALHWAAARGDEKMAQALLDAGAYASVANRDCQAPSEVAKHYNHMALAEMLEGVERRQQSMTSEEIRRGRSSGASNSR